MNRARAREGARNIASACRNDLGRCEAGGLNNVVTALLTAIENLADVSEDQDRELAELHKRIGSA